MIVERPVVRPAYAPPRARLTPRARCAPSISSLPPLCSLTHPATTPGSITEPYDGKGGREAKCLVPAFLPPQECCTQESLPPSLNGKSATVHYNDSTDILALIYDYSLEEIYIFEVFGFGKTPNLE